MSDVNVHAHRGRQLVSGKAALRRRDQDAKQALRWSHRKIRTIFQVPVVTDDDSEPVWRNKTWQTGVYSLYIAVAGQIQAAYPDGREQLLSDEFRVKIS